MKLMEVFSQLTYGELSQLNIGGAEQGEINESNYDAVLAHINLGLTALYKRFPLKEERLNLSLVQGRLVYPLTPAFAVNNSRSKEATRFILDLPTKKFIGDILKVEQVLTSSGVELPLNDGSDIYSVFTPSATTLRIPNAIVHQTPDLPDRLKTSTLEIVYRANHPILSQDTPGFNIDTYELELPYTHLEPLLFFVASRVNNPIGMVNEFNAGNNYAAKFEMACQQLEQFNLNVDQGSQNTGIERGGWV